jgi:hypothetical protein
LTLPQSGIASGSKAKALAAAKVVLGEKVKVLLTKKERKDLAITRLFQGKSNNQCPCCKKGKMVSISSWEANFKIKNKSSPITVRLPIIVLNDHSKGS